MPGTGPSVKGGKHDLELYANIAEKVAREAGSLIVKSLEEKGVKIVDNKATHQETDRVDLVTETDRKAEEAIIAALKKEVPRHRFVGEEGAFFEGSPSPLTDEPTWFIDPLDGTINFMHGFPFVTVSIGLYIRQEPVVGVIFNPLTNEMFKAWDKGGAWLNGKKIAVASAKAVSESIIATAIGSSRASAYANRILSRVRGLLLLKLQGLRVSGSTAQNMAYVACGRLDAYYDEGGYGGPWDVAAGVVLVKEAGGVVRAIDGGPFVLTMGKGSMVCGNQTIVEEVVKSVKDANDKLKRQEWLYKSLGVGLAVGGAAIGYLLAMRRVKISS